VSKGKLKKFAEVATFSNVLQPPFEEVFRKDFSLKGKWHKDHFSDTKPITLELGCGKGEYSVGLARMYPDRNFIGIDIKGSRIWKGARAALEEGLMNVSFVRARIDFIESFFDRNEVDEIWVTFPDPQLNKPLKRLTSTRFLKRYQSFLKPEGFVNLKTDSVELYHYTSTLIRHNALPLEFGTADLYNSAYDNQILSIKTYYENIWLEEGKPIHYLRFQLPNKPLTEPSDED